MYRVLSIDDMLSGKKSKYALAIAVAKRAREITDEILAKGEILEEKAVSMAIKEFKEHKYEIMEPVNYINN
jgi:DNA-directed RNA polymerase, omega subunit